MKHKSVYKTCTCLLLYLIIATTLYSDPNPLEDGLYAKIDTTLGVITCRLDYVEVPLVCANFISLAEGSQNWLDTNGIIRAEPYFDGLIFHRVINGFMIQGGDPNGTGTGGPGYAFPDQISTNLSHSKAGILSMANSGKDSNGSQFFITLAPTLWLDGKHAVFGEVVGELDRVYSIGDVAVDGNSKPLTNVVMNEVQILRIGQDAEDFDATAQPLPKILPLNIIITNGSSNLDLTTTLSNKYSQTIYQTTNLHDWTEYASVYSQSSEAWSISTPTNDPLCIFNGSKVYYPQAKSSPVINQVITLEYSNNEIILEPQANNTGSCSLNGVSGTITNWNWNPQPYNGYLYVESDILVPLYINLLYNSLTNGNFEGNYYNSGWNYFEGTFSHTAP